MAFFTAHLESEARGGTQAGDARNERHTEQEAKADVRQKHRQESAAKRRNGSGYRFVRWSFKVDVEHADGRVQLEA